MEFDGKIAKLQGTICSLGAQGLLNNADSQHKVIEEIGRLVEGIPDDEKSKMTLFMVLNTKLSVSKDLKNDVFVGLFTNITPHIKKDYLITYIYHLHLESQLFQLIESSPTHLSIELLDVIMKKIKEPSFVKDEFGTGHYYQLWQSVFIKICKIDRFMDAYCGCLEKFITHFQDIYCLIQKILVTSMKDWNRNKGCEIFIGRHLNHFFTTLLFCLQILKMSEIPENSIYKFGKCLTQCNLEVFNFLFPVNVCISMIFNEIFNIVENVTVDLWITLSECCLESGSQDSAQLVIGDLVYKILQHEKPFNSPPKSLNCLSSLAINKSDALAKAGIDEIVSKIEDVHEKTWFEALVRHPGVLEEKSVTCLIQHLQLADARDLSVILNTCYEYLCNSKDGEDVERVKELFLAAVKKTPDYSEWLQKVFEKYRPNLLATTRARDDVIRAFNKTAKDRSMSDQELVSLCLQSPRDTIRSICHAAIGGSQRAEAVVDILKLLKPPCSVPLSAGLTLLDSVLLDHLEEEPGERERRSLVGLVVELGKQDLLGPLFLNNLLAGLKRYLEEEAFGKAALSLEILKEALLAKIFQVETAAFLVFMSQVLEHLTWDLKSFSDARVDGRDLALSIVSITLWEAAKVEKDGPDIQWARENILKTWEGNQAHFRCSWFCPNPVGSGTFTFRILARNYSDGDQRACEKLLDGLDRPSDVRTSLVLSLFVLLPVVTSYEWRLIFTRLVPSVQYCGKSYADTLRDVLDLFVSSLILLTLNLNRDGDVYPCYKYCLRNFTVLAKPQCPDMKEESLVRIFKRIVQFLGMIEDREMRKCCLEICSPGLVEIANALKAQNAMGGHAKQLEGLLQRMQVKEAAEAVLRSLH